MKIYSNGKDRVLTGAFPSQFKLMKDGVAVPFLRTSQGSVRLTGELPIGDLDVLEVIREKVPQRQNLTADARFVMINENEADRIEQLGEDLKEKGALFEQKASELEEAGKKLLDHEDKNSERIDNAEKSLEALARSFGKEIQNDRNSLADLSGSFSRSIKETADILNEKLKEHETAKNPHKINKEIIGLANVDNTSDLNKPVSIATQKALDEKADKDQFEKVNKLLTEARKKQDSLVKSIENANLYGGVGGNELPNGGKKGQVLAKKSSKTGDYEWVNQSSGGGSVDDVKVNGTSVVTDGVASIDLTGYETKSVIEALDATDSITLADNTIYNGGTQTALTIALWASPTVSSIAEVVFSSGSTATTLSYPNSVKWIGDDISGGLFIPVSGKRYTVIFYYDGSETVGVVKGVA